MGLRVEEPGAHDKLVHILSKMSVYPLLKKQQQRKAIRNNTSKVKVDNHQRHENRQFVNKEQI